MSSRFDYVAYDEKAQADQKAAKLAVQLLEDLIEQVMPAGDNRLNAIKSLEETYMWIGKGIRDGQIDRNGSAPLQEGRGNS